YNLAVQRVTLAAPGLPWPHYFVDLSGVGGSADPASNLVIIAACRQLAPAPPPPRPPRRSPATSGPPSAPPSAPPSGAPSGAAGVTSSPPPAPATAPA